MPPRVAKPRHDDLSELGVVVKCGYVIILLVGRVGFGLLLDALPYLGPRLPSVAAGDEMVDRSFLWSDSGRSVFGGPPPGGGSLNRSGSWPEAGYASVMGGLEELGKSVVDGFEGGGAELAQQVIGAPGELAGDRERRAGV